MALVADESPNDGQQCHRQPEVPAAAIPELMLCGRHAPICKQLRVQATAQRISHLLTLLSKDVGQRGISVKRRRRVADANTRPMAAQSGSGVCCEGHTLCVQQPVRVHGQVPGAHHPHGDTQEETQVEA